MNKVCDRCPVKDVCLQNLQDKRCPIPTEPSHKETKKQ